MEDSALAFAMRDPPSWRGDVGGAVTRDRFDVDERLVAPETRFEIIDGAVEYVPPADEAHGTLHSKLSALLEAHAAPGFDVAVDMLTRTSKTSDLAPDASVFPIARDPETGGRQIEQMAFEIVSTERLGHAAKKARALFRRGVRRIFAIDVERRRALAWSPTTDTWEILSNEATILDPTLAVPLPIHTLVETAKADDAIASALLAKKNPVIETALRKSQARGVLEGKIASLLAILAARNIDVPKKAEKKIREAKKQERVDLWILRALKAKRLDDVLSERR